MNKMWSLLNLESRYYIYLGWAATGDTAVITGLNSLENEWTMNNVFMFYIVWE